jgi:glycosyltransferase involved in cell wall biosynthesis
MNEKVTLGLCVKNGAKVVKTAFDSISIQDYPHELLKLIIVDDCSSDNTLSLALEFAQKTDIKTFVTRSKGKGLGAARQIVVDNAEGDYIVWVDDDLVLPKDFIRKHVEFMEKNPNVGAAKSIINEFSTKPAIRIVDFAYLLPDPQPLNQLGVGGAIFRLKALESVGGFDVRIKGAGEDLDVTRRIRMSGWTLATNNSTAIHAKYPLVTLKAFWKQNWWYGYGNHYFFHKFKDQQFLLQLFPPYFILGGFKTAIMIYRLTGLKKVFVFVFFDSFGMIARSLGFARANLDGYGHAKGI